jgi:hypothetical protein
MLPGQEHLPWIARLHRPRAVCGKSGRYSQAAELPCGASGSPGLSGHEKGGF